MEDSFVAIEDERKFEKYRGIGKEIKAKEIKKKYEHSKSFKELSEGMKESVKGIEQVFNKTTEKADKSEGCCYLCARENPYNYIWMESEAAKDIKGREYIKTKYGVFHNNELKGAYFDPRVSGWNAEKWIGLRDKMIEQAGLPENDVVTFDSEKEFRTYQKAYKRDVIGKAGEQKTSEKSGPREKSPLEEVFEKRHNVSMKQQQSERAQRLKNRDYVYTIQNPERDVFFVKGDNRILRANVPLSDGQGNGFCIVEFDKNDILRNRDGSYSVYFNQQDTFKMYSYNEVNNDGTLDKSAVPSILGADRLKTSTYSAVNFKDRQERQDIIGIEVTNAVRLRKQV